MRGQASWQYHPYTRLDENYLKVLPFICRLAPQDTYCDIEWFDQGSPDTAHRIAYRRKGTADDWHYVDVKSACVTLKNLTADTEYETFAFRTNDPEAAGQIRRFRTGSVPGTVVNYLHPADKAYAFSGRYLCSPSMVEAPSGRLIVSMDVYAASQPQNLTILFKSDDGGKTWQYLCELFPCFWGKLFLHHGNIYMLSMTTEYGELQVGYSADEGEHWVKPVTLFPGAGMRCERGMHQAPTPVIEHNGKIWSAVDYGAWTHGGHASALVSCDASTDLMNPSDWTCSEFLPFNPEWEGAVPGSNSGCLEGNAIAGPDGNVYNLLRYQISGVWKKAIPGQITHGKALLLKADQDNPEKPLQFCRFVTLNGGMSKFVVRRDPVTGLYFSVVNEVVDDTTPAQRNVVTLMMSEDLIHWNFVKRLIDGSCYDLDAVGFQYCDFIISGNDLMYVSRTAFNHADNFHNANYITFYRIENFRSLLK